MRNPFKKTPEPTPEPETNPVADRLDLTADYILEHGWTQGAWHRPSGAVCVEGALQMVAGMKPMKDNVGVLSGEPDALYVPSLLALNNCAEAAPGPETGAMAYNDAKGRTVEEVVTLIRECAERLRAQKQAEVSS